MELAVMAGFSGSSRAGASCIRRFADERLCKSFGDAVGESPPLRSEMREVRRPSAGEEAPRRSMLMELDERRRGLGEGRWTAGEVTLRGDEVMPLCCAGEGGR